MKRQSVRRWIQDFTLQRRRLHFSCFMGTKDTQVPVFHSDILYEKLEKEGVPTEFVLIDGVDHADAAFSQTEVKDLILDYLHRTLK